MTAKFLNKLTIGFSLAVMLAVMLASVAMADSIFKVVSSRLLNPGESGNVRYQVPSHTVGSDGCNVDSDHPATATVVSDQDWLTIDRRATVTFTQCSSIGTFDYSVSSSAPVGAEAIVRISEISGGLPGNDGWQLGSSAFTVTVVDTIPPETTITDHAPNPSNSRSASFSFTGSDNAVGDLTFECMLHPVEDTFSPCSSPKTYTFLRDQTYNFEVRAKDASGNVDGNPAFYSWLVDTRAPHIIFSRRTSANEYGWNNSNVTVDWSCSDTGSGVVAASLRQTVSTEGANQSATGICQDHVGNTASNTQNGINIDKTAPTASAGASPAANANGWNNTDVTVSFSGSDGLSGIGDCDKVVLSSDGTDQSASGTCTDNAGNESDPASVGGINIDKTVPTITLFSRTPANEYGWNNSDVTVDWRCSDTGSGMVAASLSQTVSTEGANQSATGICQDHAGNTASNTQNGINIDKTAPTASASASPAPNSNGWNSTDVEISFSGSDGLSGIDSCNEPVVLSSEGAGQSASGTCTDEAGNISATTTASGIKIDKTAPINISFVGGGLVDGGSYYFGSVPSGPTGCTADDAVSGLTPAGCVVSGYNSAAGSHTLTATATDLAGNTATAAISYTVLGWTLNGFYSPVNMGSNVWNTLKGGTTVPLKFEVFAGSTELTDVSVVTLSAQRVSCPNAEPEVPVAEDMLTSGNTSLRYDWDSGQFIQNWKTPKKPGMCYEVTMATSDGSTLVANFELK